MHLKALIYSLATLALSVPAWADDDDHHFHSVPEVSSNGALAAIVAIAALAAILYERRRRA
jgi:hypothetical protein